jgi:hypothetical protein
MYGQGLRTISCDRFEDGIGCLGPDEWLGVVIVVLNEGSDIGLELIDAAMDAALDLLVGEQREPAFDLIEPGGAGFAVGTPITGCPPPRSGRARLRHPAPTSGG